MQLVLSTYWLQLWETAGDGRMPAVDRFMYVFYWRSMEQPGCRQTVKAHVALVCYNTWTLLAC